ncbi:glycosyltransferase [Granulosicoccaceae sp. 1_MG-2023]|nr:glycosyltransferase [Granulosicoccaceae sp. 1_MG-2023]
MKILYLMTEPFGYGGVQSDLLALSEDLSKRDHDVLVATSEGELLDELKAKGATFIDIDFHFGLSSPLKFFKSVMALRKAIKEHQVEMLAPQSVRSTLVSWIALRVLPFSYRVAKTARRVPIVTTIHNIHNPVHFRYAGRILNLCTDHVIFESHYERNRCMASGLPDDKCEVVHSGIDTDRFAPQPVSQALLEQYGLDKSRNKIFGIVARLSEEKGHPYLFRAFKKVLEKEPDARLLVVGDGPLKEQVTAERDALGLQDTVIFTGAQRNIPDYLSIFDVFVLSSTRESFPLAAREAMAAGRAVIAPRIGGCPEVVDENKTGYLFEAANVDDLAEQMLKIIADDKYIEFGERSRQRVVDLFSRKQWIIGDEKAYLSFTGS